MSLTRGVPVLLLIVGFRLMTKKINTEYYIYSHLVWFGIKLFHNCTIRARKTVLHDTLFCANN